MVFVTKKKYKEDISSLEDRIDKISKEESELYDKYLELKQEKISLQIISDKYLNKIHEYDHKIKSLSGKIGGMSTKKKSLEREIERLSSNLSKSEKIIKDQERELKVLKSRPSAEALKYETMHLSPETRKKIK